MPEQRRRVGARTIPSVRDGDEAGITVVREWAIEGLGAAYERLAPGASTDLVIDRLRRHAADAGLPLPAGRGLKEAFVWLADLLRGRRLIKDWGEYPATVDWLSLHVPPGGSGSFTIEDKSKEQAGLTLKLLGTEVGSGRGLSLSVNESFLERKRCARLTQHVTVRVRTFDIAGATTIESSVTALRHHEVRVWDPCPLCGRRAEDLHPFDYEPAGQGVDLRRDDTGHTRSDTTQITVNQRRDIGLDLQIPGLGGSGKIGLSSERSVELTCTTDYAFPPRMFFLPYRALADRVSPPFWALG
jgi:hypothetical protein